MANPAKAKGDAHERVVVEYLRSRLGQHIGRPRAGEQHDRGDVVGVANVTIEAKSYKDLATGIRVGLADLEREQANADTRWGIVVLKRPRVANPAKQLVVMELDQFVDLLTCLPENEKRLRMVEL